MELNKILEQSGITIGLEGINYRLWTCDYSGEWFIPSYAEANVAYQDDRSLLLEIPDQEAVVLCVKNEQGIWYPFAEDNECINEIKNYLQQGRYDTHNYVLYDEPAIEAGLLETFEEMHSAAAFLDKVKELDKKKDQPVPSPGPTPKPFTPKQITVTPAEILAYDKLDKDQANLLKDLISILKNRIKHNPSQYANFSLFKINPVSEEDLINWEKSHNIRLPEEYRWYLLNVGTGYMGCAEYGDYDLFHDNARYTKNLEDCPSPDGNGYEVFPMFLKLHFLGCSFDAVLGTRPEDYGKVYEISGDILELYSIESEDELREEIKSLSRDPGEGYSEPYDTSFLHYIKQGLLLEIAVADRFCHVIDDPAFLNSELTFTFDKPDHIFTLGKTLDDLGKDDPENEDREFL